MPIPRYDIELEAREEELSEGRAKALEKEVEDVHHYETVKERGEWVLYEDEYEVEDSDEARTIWAAAHPRTDSIHADEWDA